MKTAIEAMYSRRSIREFENDLVPQETILNIVAAAGRAPSSKNTQPWTLFLLQGAALDALKADYLAAFDANALGKPDYRYSPDPLPESWMSRARACGIGIFKHKGIGRDDTDKRRKHDRLLVTDLVPCVRGRSGSYSRLFLFSFPDNLCP